MNIKQIIIVGIAGMTMGVMALDNVEVTDVKARQRYPWNGKVDIDFTLDSKPTEPYQMQVEVYDNIGKTNLPVKSVCTEGISFEGNPTMVREDTRRIIWDASKDLPNGFKCTNVLVTCRDSRVNAESNRYMIVDLSAGAAADKYTVSYTNAAPAGGWTEEHMTTKLVLRKIPAGSFVMGSPNNETDHNGNETLHEVLLTKAFYLSIFELTASQCALITGTGTATLKPVELGWYEIRGNDLTPNITKRSWLNGNLASWTYEYNGTSNSYTWPYDSEVDPQSLMGKMRAKTSLKFDLPTEAQWEYACRAGTVAPFYLGETNSVLVAKKIKGEPKYDSLGDHLLYVGQYMPNALGLYDMQGNVREWCLDIYTNDLGTAKAVDPVGVKEPLPLYVHQHSWDQEGRLWLSYYGYERVIRGDGLRSAQRMSGQVYNLVNSGYAMKNPSNENQVYANPVAGVRLALTVNE